MELPFYSQSLEIATKVSCQNCHQVEKVTHHVVPCSSCAKGIIPIYNTYLKPFYQEDRGQRRGFWESWEKFELALEDGRSQTHTSSLLSGIRPTPSQSGQNIPSADTGGVQSAYRPDTDPPRSDSIATLTTLKFGGLFEVDPSSQRALDALVTVAGADAALEAVESLALRGDARLVFK